MCLRVILGQFSSLLHAVPGYGCLTYLTVLSRYSRGGQHWTLHPGHLWFLSPAVSLEPIPVDTEGQLCDECWCQLSMSLLLWVCWIFWFYGFMTFTKLRKTLAIISLDIYFFTFIFLSSLPWQPKCPTHLCRYPWKLSQAKLPQGLSLGDWEFSPSSLWRGIIKTSCTLQGFFSVFLCLDSKYTFARRFELVTQIVGAVCIFFCSAGAGTQSLVPDSALPNTLILPKYYYLMILTTLGIARCTSVFMKEIMSSGRFRPYWL